MPNVKRKPTPATVHPLPSLDGVGYRRINTYALKQQCVMVLRANRDKWTYISNKSGVTRSTIAGWVDHGKSPTKSQAITMDFAMGVLGYRLKFVKESHHG